MEKESWEGFGRNFGVLVPQGIKIAEIREFWDCFGGKSPPRHSLALNPVHGLWVGNGMWGCGSFGVFSWNFGMRVWDGNDGTPQRCHFHGKRVLGMLGIPWRPYKSMEKGSWEWSWDNSRQFGASMVFLGTLGQGRVGAAGAGEGNSCSEG